MIRNIIRKGTISQIYNQEGIIRAQVTVLDPENPEDVVLWMPYGHNSCPTIGSQVIIQAVFGNLEDKFAYPANIDHAPILSIGETILYDNFGNTIYLKNDGNIAITAAAEVNITATNTSTSGTINSTGAINTAAVYKVADTQVVSSRGAAVPDAAGGATIDVQARTAINTLLARLRVHGLIS